MAVSAEFVQWLQELRGQYAAGAAQNRDQERTAVREALNNERRVADLDEILDLFGPDGEPEPEVDETPQVTGGDAPVAQDGVVVEDEDEVEVVEDEVVVEPAADAPEADDAAPVVDETVGEPAAEVPAEPSPEADPAADEAPAAEEADVPAAEPADPEVSEPVDFPEGYDESDTTDVDSAEDETER